MADSGRAGDDLLLSPSQYQERPLQPQVVVAGVLVVGLLLSLCGDPPLHVQPHSTLEPNDCGRDQNAADHSGLGDRKSTRLNSSHANISYAVFCLKKQNIQNSVN